MLEGIVLAGGFGTRLREVVPDWPKPMAPIAGRPFLEIMLGNLAKQGFGRVVLSLGYLSEKIIAHFDSEFAGLELAYVVEKFPLGTGGAVRLALNETSASHVFVFNGDTFLDLEIEAVENQWQAHRLPIIVGREVPDTARYGRLLTYDGKVTGFTEKGVQGPGLINAGCYILNRGQLDEFPVFTSFSLESDYLARIVEENPVDIFVTNGQFIDIGIPEDYARAQTELANR